MIIELRYASNPEDFRQYDTSRIRKEFLIENLFLKDEIYMVYSMYDRYMVGGAMPVRKHLRLESGDELKSEEFLDRREMGIINIGGEAEIKADKTIFRLGYKEALYIGKGTKDVFFSSADPDKPARLYINSAPAHHTFSTAIITRSDADKSELGNPESSNHRTLNRMIVASIKETCQLQMGITELKKGSVWNTMPVHTHNRRMEAYFYFELPENQAVCHFMGIPDETRHIWMRNEQAVLSPSWSIHSAAGTSSYTFIWGMAGENLDYGDMDVRQPHTLR